jgi:hypothetical protein
LTKKSSKEQEIFFYQTNKLIFMKSVQTRKTMKGKQLKEIATIKMFRCPLKIKFKMLMKNRKNLMAVKEL